jgi:hypothetical protein
MSRIKYRGWACHESKIEAGQKAPFALEYLDRMFVTVVKDRVDLAGQRRKPPRMLVLDPQAQAPNRGRSRMPGHAYSKAMVYREEPG